MSSTPVAETPSPASASGHDAKGRFAAGNRLAVGNPFARRVAALRQAFLKEVKAEDIAAIASALLAKAKAGDVAAAKLVLAYTVGKPQDTVDPDHLDLDEWQKFQETGDMLRDLPDMVLKPHPALPLTILNTARPLMTEKMRQDLVERLLEPTPGRRRRGGKAKRHPHAQRQDHTPAQPSPSTTGSNGGCSKPRTATRNPARAATGTIVSPGRAGCQPVT